MQKSVMHTTCSLRFPEPEKKDCFVFVFFLLSRYMQIRFCFYKNQLNTLHFIDLYIWRCSLFCTQKFIMRHLFPGELFLHSAQTLHFWIMAKHDSSSNLQLSILPFHSWNHRGIEKLLILLGFTLFMLLWIWF